MRIGRTLPPAAAPIYPIDIATGLGGLFKGKRENERFENELKEHFNMPYCFLLSSGKAALTVILRALREIHPDRDEVLVPAYSCYSVPSAIVRAGLKIKLCDINPDTLDFDYNQLEIILFNDYAKQTRELNSPVTNRDGQKNKILAIIPTHLFGLPADIARLRKKIADPGITIIEDAAQAMGGKMDETLLGTFGDVALFSLGRGKAFSTVEGGVVLTRQKKFADKLNELIDKIPQYSFIEKIKLVVNAILLIFFQKPWFFWFPRILPFLRVGETIYDPKFKIRQFTAFQAGLARNWLYKLEEFISYRIKHVDKYTLLLKNKYKINQSIFQEKIPSLIRFPLQVESKDIRQDILKQSEKLGYGIMTTYPDSIDGIRELRCFFNQQKCLKAKKICATMITLPVHPYVEEEDMEKIVEMLNRYTSCLC